MKTLESIIKIVTEACGCTYADVISKCKYTKFVYARKLIAHFTKACNIPLTHEEIGKILNLRHSTISNHKQNFKNNIDGDRVFMMLYELVKRELDMSKDATIRMCIDCCCSNCNEYIDLANNISKQNIDISEYVKTKYFVDVQCHNCNYQFKVVLNY